MATITIYPESVTWNSVTYSKGVNAGILSLSVDNTGQKVEQRSADDLYATFCAYVDAGCEVVMRITDVKQTVALNTKSDMVAKIKGKATSTTITLNDMVYGGVRMTQDRAVPGYSEMIFSLESDDGSTHPVS